MSITDMDFEDVDVPQGTFIGWGEIGQTVTGTVISYAPEGGSDFNDNVCPQLVVSLTEPALNFKDKGATRETIEAGEFATLTCGLANLKRTVAAAALEVGDVVRIKYDSTYKTPKGEGKSFKVQVARGAGKSAAPTATASGPQQGDIL